MPRDGSNVYHYPTGIEGNPDEIIESAGYNSFLADVEQDANLPRPILSGGTGATSADAALVNLGAEKASQIVTNYDSDIFVAGSFSSAGSATSSPVAGHAFAGIVYVADSNNLVIEARDLDDTAAPPQMYVRQKKAGVWGAWTPDFNQTTQDSRYVNVTGDNMNGDLSITEADPRIYMVKQTGARSAAIVGANGFTFRWILELGNTEIESSGNVGSNFGISRYSDAGSLIGSVISFNRATGLGTVVGNPTSALGIATKQYADLSPKLAGGQNFTGGFTFTTYTLGNLGSSLTINPILSNYQYGINNAALTISAPSTDCAVDLLVVNDVGAGPITFSGFFVNAANTGDSLTTTLNHRFIISIRRLVGVATYIIKALQ